MASTHAPGTRSPIIAALVVYTVVGLVLGVFAAFLVIYSGAFNVAATVKDSAPLRWVLITTREASVRRHARAVEAPRLGGTQQVENGLRLFRDQCAMCHTPPGGQATMMSDGLNPQAPPLAELVSDMNDAELFWVTKNGIRFTGMPAWTTSHKDREIWDVVAFMRASVTMRAADYDALDQRPSGPPDRK